MKNFIALIMLCTTLTLQAITVKDIKFEGMVHISPNVALQMLPFKIGDEITERNVDAAVHVFYKQGYFNDIWVDNSDGIMTFYFKEKDIISSIEMDGYKDNDKEVQEGLLQIKKGSLYNEKKIEAAKRRIIEALSAEGKIDTVVETRTERLENGSIRVVFMVNEGEKIVIDNIDLNGMNNLSTSDFNDVLANKEAEFMGWFWGRNDGEMKLPEMEYDPLRMRDTYMQHGYLDAKVDAPFVRINFDNYRANMSYQIQEGPVYRVSDISVMQQEDVIDNSKLLEMIRLEKNDVFNIKTFRDDADRLKTVIANLGYAYAQVKPDLQKNTTNNSVHVIYRLVPGAKVRIRNVIIDGNSRTLDRIVRRELYLAPGDWYNLTDLKDSRNALGRTGYFDSTTVEEKRIDEFTMDLIVKVKEAPTGNVQVGGGYGSYGGLLFSVGVEDRNIFGTGINMGINLERSDVTENYAFNISNQRLNDSDFSGNFSIYTSMYEYNDYTVDSQGVTLGTGHRFTRHWSGYLSYNYSKNEYSDINESAINYDYHVFFENYSKSSVTAAATFDNTDDYYLPRSGVVFKQSLEYAGMGADAEFMKSRTSFNLYYGLEDMFDFDLIFRYKSRYHYVKEEGYLPLAERFYMGGMGSVRGYESYSLSPSYVDASGYTRRIGGTQTFSNNFELSFPLVPKAKMRLSAFYDWGWIEGNVPAHTSLYNVQKPSEKQSIMRSGAGLSIEWFSPVGPVNLIFARALDDEPGDKTTNFEFTIGQRF
ncbi:MAG: outer membrane protein assembly factor BamA [Campylobacterota bacterium]|nr:outer membrane protein assembly factor BamA [Campylobacterota bacterium]